MGPEARQWLGVLPWLIFAGVMLWRFRSLDRARPLRVASLWIMPAVIVGMIGIALYGMHPTLPGWLLVALGMAVGSVLGAQRARLMRLHIEGEGADARVMMRQSMAALILIVGIVVLRHMLFAGFQTTPGSHPTAGALLVTDAMLGFAVGVICVQRIVLWLRARQLVAQHLTGDEGIS